MAAYERTARAWVGSGWQLASTKRRTVMTLIGAWFGPWLIYGSKSPWRHNIPRICARQGGRV